MQLKLSHRTSARETFERILNTCKFFEVKNNRLCYHRDQSILQLKDALNSE